MNFKIKTGWFDKLSFSEKEQIRNIIWAIMMILIFVVILVIH